METLVGKPAIPAPDEIRFSCTACGKCCNTPPVMPLMEALRHTGDFVFMGMLHRQEDAAFEDDGDHAAWVAEAGVPFEVPELNGLAVKRFHASIIAVPIAFPGACPQLMGKECGIYARRPSKCRAVPLEPEMPESWTGPLLQEWRGKIEKAGYECDFSSPASILWSKRSGIAPEARRDWQNWRAEASSSRPIVQEIFEQVTADYPKLIPDVLEREAEQEFPFSGVLLAMRATGVLDDAALRRHAHAQMALAESMIADALRRRRSSDRATTQVLRLILREYMRQPVFAQHYKRPSPARAE